jgi:hypothetical protein
MCTSTIGGRGATQDPALQPAEAKFRAGQPSRPPITNVAQRSRYGGVVAEVVPSQPARGAQANDPRSEFNMRKQSSQQGTGGTGHTSAASRQLSDKPKKRRPVKQLDLFRSGPRPTSSGHNPTTRQNRGGAK